MSEEHKHCPFCGFSNIEANIEATPFGRFGVIACQICGVKVYGMGVMIPEDEPADNLLATAYKAWNTRSEARE